MADSAFTRRSLALAIDVLNELLSTTGFLDNIESLASGLDTGSLGRQLGLGLEVAKAPTDVSSGNLFTISGGRVLVTHIEGEVTTVLQAASRTLKLTFDPTASATDTDLCAASADVSGLAVGKHLTITGTLATAMAITGTEMALRQITQFILTAGVIKLTSSGASITGVINWKVYYLPIDSGATIVAA